MVNYIAQRYPSGPAEAWAFHQAHNYYGKGGWINEPVNGIGAYCALCTTLAEKGREYVTPEARVMNGHGNSGPTYNAHFDGLTGQAIEGHVRVAFQAMSMTQERSTGRDGGASHGRADRLYAV